MVEEQPRQGERVVSKREGTGSGEMLTCPQLDVDLVPVKTAESTLSRRVFAERGNSQR